MSKMFVEIGTSASRLFGFNPENLSPGDMIITVDPLTDHGARAVFASSEPTVYALGEYTGADKGIELAAKRNAEYMQRAALSGVGYSPMYADGVRLPFFSGAIDQVLLQNVIGDEQVADEKVIRILEESLRVIGSTGLVRCIETYTPDVAVRRLQNFEADNPNYPLADIEYIENITSPRLAPYTVHGIESHAAATTFITFFGH